MIRTLSRNWLLLALCGFLNAGMATLFFVLQGAQGSLTFHAWNTTVSLIGKFAIAGGVCAIAAGLVKSQTGRCWPVVLKGFALGALGVVLYGFIRFPIKFSVIAFLIILMAISLGVLAFAVARVMRQDHRPADGWIFGLAGVASVCFALAFVAMVFRWIRIDLGLHVDLLWLGAYFGFSAICLLGLALRLHGPGVSPDRRLEPLLPLGNPRHAH